MARGTYPPLPATLLKPGASFFSPTQALPERVSLEHPASDVMTDRLPRSSRHWRPEVLHGSAAMIALLISPAPDAA